MKLCEKCHTQNNDEAAYCKNCGQVLEIQKSNKVVNYNHTFFKIHPIALWSVRVLPFTIPVLIILLTTNRDYILFTDVEVIATISGFLLLSNLTLLIIFFLNYNLRWKKFYLNSDFRNAKERLTAFAFSQNKSEETVKISENSKNELRLKDKSLGTKGYFHLIKEKEGNVLLIGEKYNTQSLIRTVFGQDINFIEK